MTRDELAARIFLATIITPQSTLEITIKDLVQNSFEYADIWIAEQTRRESLIPPRKITPTPKRP